MAWNDILGHEFVKRIWQAHLEAGTVPGAYLLAGPEGIGKRRLALEMAKALNCTASAGRPCDRCATCVQIARQTHPDVHALVPGGASDQIKIEEIRQLIGRVALRPFSARVQVALIDGAQRLTEEAANSLLKALEEPSAHTRFVLVTAQLSHCLPTIVSRCHVLRCQPLPVDAVSRIVITASGCDAATAAAAARLSHGSASAAIALASRWDACQRVIGRFAAEAPTAWLTRPLPETRQEVSDLLEGMMSWLRDVALAAAGGDTARLGYPAHQRAAVEQARAFDLDRCLATALELVDLRESLEQFVSPRLVAALVREKWLNLHNESP